MAVIDVTFAKVAGKGIDHVGFAGARFACQKNVGAGF